MTQLCLWAFILLVHTGERYKQQTPWSVYALFNQKILLDPTYKLNIKLTLNNSNSDISNYSLQKIILKKWNKLESDQVCFPLYSAFSFIHPIILQRIEHGHDVAPKYFACNFTKGL